MEVVFFGEPLPDVLSLYYNIIKRADTVITIGSSLNVSPINILP